MSSINLKKEVTGNMDEVIEKLTKSLGTQGFGILTRIDFHTKMKEKLGKEVLPTVILGACNPALAYEAFQKNTDIAGLIPCNAVVRTLDSGKISIELTKPSAMMLMLGDQELAHFAKEADQMLVKVLEGFPG